MSTCRFCGEFVHHTDEVKYQVRHYAHFSCYLDAGKLLADLHPWQVNLFQYRVLADRDLLEVATLLTKSENAGASWQGAVDRCEAGSSPVARSNSEVSP